MEKIIKLLEKIKEETQDINYGFIYKLIIVKKKDIGREDFLAKTLKDLSDNYEWDEKKILVDRICQILSNQNYSKVISFDKFIDVLAETIPSSYKEELYMVFSDYNGSKSKIYKFDLDVAVLICPYFDSIFFVETQDQYIIFSLGYVD